MIAALQIQGLTQEIQSEKQLNELCIKKVESLEKKLADLQKKQGKPDDATFSVKLKGDKAACIVSSATNYKEAMEEAEAAINKLSEHFLPGVPSAKSFAYLATLSEERMEHLKDFPSYTQWKTAKGK